jgi:hypothetical protein
LRIIFSSEGPITFSIIRVIPEKNLLESANISESTSRVKNFSSLKNSIFKFEQKEGGTK